MAEPRSWQAMWRKYEDRLEEQTGVDVGTWNRRILDEAPDEETGLRRWLDERGLHGYVQSLLVMERFGYPDFLTASTDEVIAAQFDDREHLRPILHRILTIVAERHPEVEVQGRKTYVPLFTPRRQFAVVKATTRDRVDLGLRLDGTAPRGRLEPARSLANDTINVRVGLHTAAEVDDEVVGHLEEAWDRNV